MSPQARRPTAAALLESDIFAPLEADYGELLRPLSLPPVSLGIKIRLSLLEKELLMMIGKLV